VAVATGTTHKDLRIRYGMPETFLKNSAPRWTGSSRP
jgi:hypothetical protein